MASAEDHYRETYVDPLEEKAALPQTPEERTAAFYGITKEELEARIKQAVRKQRIAAILSLVLGGVQQVAEFVTAGVILHLLGVI